MKRLLFLFWLIACFLLAGCANSEQQGSTPVTTTDALEAQQSSAVPPAETTDVVKHNTMQLTLYYPSADGAHLVPEVRSFPINDSPARIAVEALLSGTNQPQTAKVFPSDTKLRRLWIKDEVAYVDFNKAILKGNGGSASEILLVASVVNTLTEFPSVEKVKFLVEGKAIDTLYGHMDLSEPLSRSPGIIKK
jgi:spore germination protein GerM